MIAVQKRRGTLELMTIEIVSVGTELLLGQIVDTNAAWLSARLAEIGVGVYRRTTVGDNRERIVRALREALERADGADSYRWARTD
jgi:nicotinamide-nucleotide amidase